MDRAKIRVGRDVNYRPTDAQATTGNGNAGDVWSARITAVNADSTVNLFVYEADGGFVALTDISEGSTKGTFDTLGAGPQTV